MTFAEKCLDRKTMVLDDFFGSYIFHFDLSNRDLESSFYYFMPEAYEFDTQRYIKEFVRPGMTVFDIGAHYGLFTILLAHCAGPNGRVFSFEPEEYNFLRLKKNIDSNDLPQVNLQNLAASNITGTAQIVLDSSSTAHHISYEGDDLKSIANKQTIKTIKLDEFAENHALDHIDLIKIDAEKSEDLVLSGASDLMKSGRMKNVICEIHSTNKAGKCGGDKIRQMFYVCGYKSYVLNPRLARQPYLSELEPESPVTGLQNLLFKQSD